MQTCCWWIGICSQINAPNVALDGLRKACPSTLVVVLISHLDARKQAALSVGADIFISKGESPERVAEHLRIAAASVSTAISLADSEDL